MLTVFYFTLRESMNRRMGMALIGTALAVSLLFAWSLQFTRSPAGELLISSGHVLLGPARVGVPVVYEQLLQFTESIWLFLALFAAAPLLTSTLESGWLDLVFSKGVRRWEILIGRFAGILALFALTLCAANLSVASYVWARTGIGPGRLVVALGFVIFSFSTLLAVMALSALAVPTPAIPIIVGFLLTILSRLLARREQDFYIFIQSAWARSTLDWSYRILPKNYELQRMADMYMMRGTMADWWPVWTSALFLAAMLALAAWTLHRKSF